MTPIDTAALWVGYLVMGLGALLAVLFSISWILDRIFVHFGWQDEVLRALRHLRKERKNKAAQAELERDNQFPRI